MQEQTLKSKRVIIWLVLFICAPYSYAQKIKAYLYHMQPPFVVEPLRNSNMQNGLAADFVQLLNQHKLNTSYVFELSPRPRQRLNHELAPWISGRCDKNSLHCDSNWIVLFVTPQWGWGENAERRFRWIALFEDADLIISNVNNRVHFDGFHSFKNKVFGTMLGHKYPAELEKMFQLGITQRDDATQMSVVLNRIMHNRVDVAMIQQSHLHYRMRHGDEAFNINSNIYISNSPFKSFTVQVMLPLTQSSAFEELIKSVAASKEWVERLCYYGIKPLNDEADCLSEKTSIKKP
ncbi:hypothetical protein [Thalassotalea fusca]